MLFLSSYTNRLDKKGRVSVPAPFRAVLAQENFNGIYASVSLTAPRIECCGPAHFKTLHRMYEQMDPFSPERDAFAATVFGEITQLNFDAEGRVLLPEALLDHAEIREEAVFVGKGDTFEIWEPRAYKEYKASARSSFRKKFHGKGA